MADNFLPICDLLFNFISVASYFCDVAFDIIVIYTFYQTQTNWFLVLLVTTIISLFACQILSVKWSIDESANDPRQSGWRQFLLGLVHVLQLGVLWRYSKLLCAPIDIQHVKREMRNLCLLRMVHGFCQSLVFLLVQGYLFARETQPLGEVHSVSIALSLLSVCWALASFNKNVRTQNIDKLVLTWIGVIVQLMWRLGTVASRCLSLVIYASAYNFWIFLVAFLHWTCMFLWLAIPKNNYARETASRTTKLCWSLVLSYVYIFCYINVEDSNTKLRMVFFYVMTFAENILLVVLWTMSVKASLDYDQAQRRNIVVSVVLLFVFGMLFMLLYYKMFHVSKLGNHGEQTFNVNSCRSSSERSGSERNNQCGNGNQAVFNCALNPAMKKKKLPSVVPPPPPAVVQGKCERPFWKEPLPEYNQLEWDNQETPKDIEQKLMVKRQNQLKHLEDIETEIRNGRLDKPPSSGQRFHHDIFPPVPSLKRQPAVPPYFRANFEANDSSGDQGDVDSGEELPKPRRLAHLHSQKTFKTPL